MSAVDPFGLRQRDDGGLAARGCEDADGTLAATGQFGHPVAFDRAFEAIGLPWRWSDARYGELLVTAGGTERLLVDFASRNDAPREATARLELAGHSHRLNNEHYAAIVGGGDLPLREGVAELLEDCATAGVRVGVATPTSDSNIDALLSAHLGRGWRRRRRDRHSQPPFRIRTGRRCAHHRPLAGFASRLASPGSVWR